MIVLHRFFLPSRSIIKRYLNSLHLTPLLIALALQVPAIQAAQPDNHIDTADFYQGAALHHPQLSPDGTHIAVLQDVGNDTIILVRNLITGESFYPIKSDNERFKFNWIGWGNNDRLLMSVRFSNNRGMRVLFTETRLLAIDAKKPSEVTTLIRPDAKADGWISQFQDNIIHWLHDDPEHVLISVDRESPAKQSVYKLNIYNGKTQRVKKFNAGIRSWLADQQGEVRVGVGYNDTKRETIIRVLPAGSKKWQTAWRYTLFEDPSITPLGFGHNPNELYLLADHEGRQAVFKSDLSKEGFPLELVISHPQYDIAGSLIYSHAHKEVVGLYYSDDAFGSIFWNPEFKGFQAGLDKALPDSANYIASLSNDGRKYLLFSSHQTDPGTYYYGNRDTKELTAIAEIYPGIDRKKLTAKQQLKYKARDGLELEGFLTLPAGGGKNLPTLIFPHGGPMSKDGAEFDSFSAFFANRGYAVFQPNFRGSSGYGHEFMMMAVASMGLAMQDDLEDAVHFLAKEGITDEKRVCIVGASYGGYAALSGATKTPDLYRCAISFAGISDIVRLRETSRYFLNSRAMQDQLGRDTSQLRETSPARFAEQVKIPILLVHGDNDTIVPVNQSQLMHERLKRAGKDVTYIELEDGSHFLDYYEHRKITFEAMEAFLQKHLPVNIKTASTSLH